MDEHRADPLDLNKSYRKLISEYKRDILSNIKEPQKLAQNLGIQLLDDGERFLNELNSDPSRKRRHELLFNILRATKLRNFKQVRSALRLSGENELEQIFQVIWRRIRLVLKERGIRVKFDPERIKHKHVEDDPPPIEVAENRGENVPLKVIKSGDDDNVIDMEDSEVVQYPLHFAARTHNVHDLKQLLENNRKKNWLFKGRTPLHDALFGGSSKEAYSFIKCLLDHVKEQDQFNLLQPGESFDWSILEDLYVNSGVPSETCPWSLPQFVDFRELEGEGRTAMHMAIQKESLQIIELLSTYFPSLIVPNSNGETVLEQMYEKTPRAAARIMDGCATTDNDFVTDGSLKVDVDFLPVVGCTWKSRDSHHGKGDHKKIHQPVECGEMFLLANLVFRNFQRPIHLILRHVVVKAFLELKWKKLRWIIWTAFVFYVLVHLSFVVFVVNLFVLFFPYASQFSCAQSRALVSGMCAENSTIAQNQYRLDEYLFGKWDMTDTVGFIAPAANKIPEYLKYWAYGSLVVGFILMVIESMEIVFIGKISAKGGTSKKSQWQSFFALIWRLFVPGILVIIGIRNNFFTRIVLYFMAAFAVLIFVMAGWTVCFTAREIQPKKKRDHSEAIFFKFCRFILLSLEAYLENLENLFQLSFVFSSARVAGVVWEEQISESYYVMAAWSVLIAGGSILLQVGNLYEPGEYVHMLKAVLKKFLTTMMTFSILFVSFAIAYGVVFSEEKYFMSVPAAISRFLPMFGGEFNYDSLLYGSRDSLIDETTPLTYGRHSINVAFNFVMSVALYNLLIGITVSDVAKIREKSDVIHRSIQVERLYVVENILSVWLLRKLRCNPDMNVVADRVQGQDMVVQLNLRDLSRELRKEFRGLLAVADIDSSKTD